MVKKEASLIFFGISSTGLISAFKFLFYIRNVCFLISVGSRQVKK